jgi:hypothetical protein
VSDDPTTTAAGYVFVGDASAFTEAVEAVREQADEAAHLAEFRAGVGRAPEPSPERTARLAALPVTRYEKRGDDA